jgi:broad specificity phosphatase PhoE
VADKAIGYVVRHGQTHENVEDSLKSWLDDPLDETGKEQAKQAAIYLGHRTISCVYSSPLLRAVESALYFVGSDSLQQDRALATWHAGRLAGISKEDSQDVIELFIENSSIAPPDGESVDQFEERLAEFFNRMLPESEKHGPYAFYTHNTVITALSNMLEGKRAMSIGEFKSLIDTGGVLGVFCDGDTYRLDALFEPKETR